MTAQLGRLLQQIEPFAAMPAETRAEVEAIAQHKAIAAKGFLTLAGEYWPYLMLVEQGLFEAVKESTEGRSLHVLSVRTGEVFWGVSFFDQKLAMPVSLRAIEDSRLALWEREQILTVLINCGAALWSLCGLMIRRVQVASEIVDDLAFQPVAARLAKLLLEQYPQQGMVSRDLTLDEMAARIGTTREMVCRILYRLADEDLIDITRTEVSLIDRSALVNIAGKARGKGADDRPEVAQQEGI
jgi:CRP-like cAMP-binding protein